MRSVETKPQAPRYRRKGTLSTCTQIEKVLEPVCDLQTEERALGSVQTKEDTAGLLSSTAIISSCLRVSPTPDINHWRGRKSKNRQFLKITFS